MCKNTKSKQTSENQNKSHQIAKDCDVLEISSRLIKQNQKAYEVLAK